MRANGKLSDIEELLADQSWKTNKLPPLSTRSKGLCKNRSVTEIEKPRKVERIITHPCHIIPEESKEEPKAETKNPFSKSSFLAVPFNKFTKMISGISNRETNANIEVPMFPKTPFGRTSLSLAIIPKFEKVEQGINPEIINEMKLSTGRVRKRSLKAETDRFEYSKDFKQITGRTLKNFLRSTPTRVYL